jgi:tRNA nucleotidyltransferase (CCA-adding enzyme)
VLALFGARFALPTGLQHGTVTVLAGELPRRWPVEVTTFRGEGVYLDGRRPSSVTFGATLPEDLARRDFTMNAIAFDPLDGQVTDPFDGRADLARGLVRAVGDPVLRFTEDGLRPMRAIRQASQLGFSIDAATLAAIPRAVASFKLVSLERIRDELLKTLASPAPARGVELLREATLLELILPELTACLGCDQGPEHAHDVFGHALATLGHIEPEPTLRLAALLHDIGKPATRVVGAGGKPAFPDHERVGAAAAVVVANRLRLPGADRDLLRLLIAEHRFAYDPSWTDGAVRRFVRRVGQANLPALLALRAADVAGRGRGDDPEATTAPLRRRVDEVLERSAALTARDLAIDGRGLMQALGLPPGPRVGRLIEALVERVIDDPSLNARPALEALGRELLPALADR